VRPDREAEPEPEPEPEPDRGVRPVVPESDRHPTPTAPESRRRGVNVGSPPVSGGESTFTVALVTSGAIATVIGTREARIGWVADRQAGLIGRVQLLAIGVSASAVDRMLRRALLRRRHPGVYLFGHRAPAAHADEIAALLAVRRPGAVLSHVTAGVIWGVLNPSGFAPTVHLTVPGGGSNRRLHAVTVHRTARLQPGDVRRRYGLPITSPARTMLDNAPDLSDRQLELALDQTIVHGLLTERERTALRARCVGRPGCARLAALLDDVDRPTTLTRSEGEELFLALVRQAELPAPLVNRFGGGRERDFRWPAERVLVEVDGWRFHRGPLAFDEDRRRDARATAAGWRTLRFTYRQLVEGPMAVIALLAQALARGATAAG
jgi:hypothetical protein